MSGEDLGDWWLILSGFAYVCLFLLGLWSEFRPQQAVDARRQEIQWKAEAVALRMRAADLDIKAEKSRLARVQAFGDQGCLS